MYNSDSDPDSDSDSGSGSYSNSGSDSDSGWEWEYNFIQTAFAEVASATIVDINNKVLYLHFDNITDENGKEIDASTVKLIDPVDNEEYDFEKYNGVPVIIDIRYFIPFVNYIVSTTEKIRGITINTNLEGGGSLVL